MKPEKKSTDQRLDEIVNMLNEKLFVKSDDEEEDNKKSKPTELTEEDMGEDLDGDYEEDEDPKHKKKVMPKLFSKSYEKLRSLKK